MGKSRRVLVLQIILASLLALFAAHLFISRFVTGSVEVVGSACHCPVVDHAGLWTEADYNLTTCGPSAYTSGDNQRVIAFTYFTQNSSHKSEESRHYFEGILANLKLMEDLYPGYVMRVYYEADSAREQELCNIYCNNKNIHLCPAVNNPRFGKISGLYPLIWRFLPALDPQVSVLMSRDLDSRLSEREVAAVQQFIASDSKIHVMRDNPNHGTSMMGGMWGAKLDAPLRSNFKEAFRKAFKDPVAFAARASGGWDQIALRRYVWPWAKKITFAHDSYTCRKFSYTHPFPTQRLTGIGNYVGSVISLNATVRNKCPYKCRPKEHKDWSYC